MRSDPLRLGRWEIQIANSAEWGKYVGDLLNGFVKESGTQITDDLGGILTQAVKWYISSFVCRNSRADTNQFLDIGV